MTARLEATRLFLGICNSKALIILLTQRVNINETFRYIAGMYKEEKYQ